MSVYAAEVGHGGVLALRHGDARDNESTDLWSSSFLLGPSAALVYVIVIVLELGDLGILLLGTTHAAKLPPINHSTSGPGYLFDFLQAGRVRIRSSDHDQLLLILLLSVMVCLLIGMILNLAHDVLLVLIIGEKVDVIIYKE